MVTLIQHEMVSGDTATPLLFQIVDENGSPRDITGCSLRYVAYYGQGDDAAILLDKSTVEGSVVLTDATTGTGRVEYAHDDTAAIGGRVLPHEFELTDIAGLVETVAAGPLKIKRDFAT